MALQTKTRLPRTGPGIGAGILLALASFDGAAQLSARDCPQPRFTEQAPDEYYKRENPFASAAPDLKAAMQIFHKDRATIACATCHGAYRERFDDGSFRIKLGTK